MHSTGGPPKALCEFVSAGLPEPHRLQMRTMQQGGESSETVIDVLSVKNRAPEVTDADFSEQRLARGV